MRGGVAEGMDTLRTGAAVRVRALALCASLLVASLPALAFDHEHMAWTALLARHVSVLPGGRASVVDYGGFALDRVALKNYLDGLSAVPPGTYAAWNRSQRLAFLINAYNAFTVQKVLTRYPGLRSIRDFGRFIGNPWKDRFFLLLGESRSLDGIEQDLLRAPGAFDEPRIHFALNCASVGCPMLREEAFTASRFEAQLEDQVVRFLSDRSRNRYRDGALEVSRIFDWYAGDFRVGTSGVSSVERFLGQYADVLADSPRDREAVRAGRVRVRFLDYDWTLNDLRR